MTCVYRQFAQFGTEQTVGGSLYDALHILQRRTVGRDAPAELRVCGAYRLYSPFEVTFRNLPHLALPVGMVVSGSPDHKHTAEDDGQAVVLQCSVLLHGEGIGNLQPGAVTIENADQSFV